jgi:Cu/Ag efflux pump CusA
MRWIIESSLRFRLLVIGVAAGVMAFGIVQLRSAPVDVLPEFTPPYVEIQTEALGLSADEVEQLITVPLEADLLNGVENVDVIRSESVPGLSSIVMVFAPDTDLFKGRALVQERMTQAHALPNVSKPPFMLQPLSSSSRVMMIGLSSKKLTPIQQGLLARWTIRPRLMGVPGVANVAIWGQREQELQVQVDPKELASKNVTLNQVIRSAGNAQLVSPLTFLEASTPGTGGFIETPTQRLGVRHVFDNLSTPEALGKITVEGTDRKLRLTDVSNIVEDHQPLIGDAVVNGGDGMMLVIEKLPGANTVEVTKNVEAALDQLHPAIAGLQVDRDVFRPASFIQQAIDNLTLTLLVGALLLAFALAAFLFAWRTVLVALVTIPLSLIAAALVLDLMGQTINAIAFAGLAAAIAVVVGDSVFGADNIARRVREHRKQGSGRPAAALVFDATLEMRGPLTYAGLIALLAIVPVIVMEGRPGAFFEPLALGYLLAILASMLVALTVTPALSLMLLSRNEASGGDSPLLAALRLRYDAMLERVMARSRAILAGAAVCALAAVAALALMGTSVIPSFKDNDVLVSLDAKPGTSQPAMSRLTADASKQLRAIPGVVKVGGHVGRAVTGDRTVDVNNSELWVTIGSGADYDKTKTAINGVVDRLQGATHDVVTYSQQQIRDTGSLRDGEANTGKDSKLEVLTGSDKPLVVRLFGESQATLQAKAKDVQRLMAGIDGVVDPKIEQVPVEPLIEVETRLDDAAKYGIRPGDVRRTEAAILQGITVGSIFGAQKVFDVTVQGAPSTRTSVESIKNILIDAEGGRHVPLGKVADVRIVNAPSVIKRDAVARRIDIKADISGRTAGAIRKDLETRLAKLPLPLEYHAEVLEEPQQEIATTAVIGFGIAALIAMFLLIQVALRSWRMAAMAFLTLPVALLGGIAAALLIGSELSLGALIGLLAVFAVAARGSISVIAHIHEVERRHAGASAALVRLAASERLAPIAGAAAATAAVLLPFAILGSRAGLEIVHPMAIVVLGGLVTATALSLLVVPALYAQFSTGEPQKAMPEDELIYHWSGSDTGEDARSRIPVVADWEHAGSRSSDRPTAGAAAAPPGSDGGVTTAKPAKGPTRAE